AERKSSEGMPPTRVRTVHRHPYSSIDPGLVVHGDRLGRGARLERAGDAVPAVHRTGCGVLVCKVLNRRVEVVLNSDVGRSDHGGDGARQHALPHRSPVIAKQGYITPSDRLQTERRITTAGALLSLTSITLTLLQVLQQLATLDHPSHQSGKFTGGRILSIQRLSHHGTHRDQLLKPTFSLRNSRDLLAPLPCVVHRAQAF